MTVDGTFDERFDALAAIAFRVAFRLTGSRGDAEDIAQESLARTALRWKRVASYDEAFVTRVATNLALGILRRRRPVLGVPSPTSRPPAAPASSGPQSRRGERASDRRSGRRRRRARPSARPGTPPRDRRFG